MDDAKSGSRLWMTVAEHLFDAARHAAGVLCADSAELQAAPGLTCRRPPATMGVMGTGTAFEAAVTEHGPRVLRVCKAVLGAGADAEDAWSETFLAALRAWPELDPQTNHEAWLVRVAQRKCIDILRARGRRPIPSEVLPERQTPTSLDADIWHQVARLPQRQRLAVAYHYFGGLPHSETAELIGSTPAAVRRAASDGVANLRRILAQEQDRQSHASRPPAPDPSRPTTRKKDHA